MDVGTDVGEDLADDLRPGLEDGPELLAVDLFGDLGAGVTDEPGDPFSGTSSADISETNE